MELRAGCHRIDGGLGDLKRTRSQVYLDPLDPVFPAGSTRQTQSPEKVDHAKVRGKHLRVQLRDPSMKRGVHESVSKLETNPPTLPAVLDHGGVLSEGGTRILVIPDDAYNLLVAVRIQGYERAPVATIEMREMPCLLLAQSRDCAEVPLEDRLLAELRVKTLQPGSIRRFDPSERNDRAVEQRKVCVC